MYLDKERSGYEKRWLVCIQTKKEVSTKSHWLLCMQTKKGVGTKSAGYYVYRQSKKWVQKAMFTMYIGKEAC